MVKQTDEFTNYIIDLMQAMGPVYAKRMFGGIGIFLEGLMFAIIDDEILYFKVDKDTKSLFDAKSLPAFSYQRQGKRCYLSYYQAPEEVFESEEEMTKWGELAYKVAFRARLRNT